MSGRSNPLDYSKIKAAVKLEWVMEREGLLKGLRRTPSGYVGPCPIHHGNNKQQFRVDFQYQLFRCFSPKCGVAGDVITLISLLHHLPPEKSAARLAEDYGLLAAALKPPTRSTAMAEAKTRGPDFNVYTVRGEGDDAWWTRIGSAWANKDGKGFNVVLDALPLDGKLVLREPKPDEEEVKPAKKGR